MINGQVLVLNQDYQPLSVCGVRRSLMLLFLEKADMLHPHPEWRIRTINRELEFPSVIRLRRYARAPFRNIVLSRKNILKRDGNRCQYCGTHEDLTIDHVLPRSRGGTDTWENLATACHRCNHKKGNRTPKEADMPLMREPYRPNHIVFLQGAVPHIADEWRPYLYLS